MAVRDELRLVLVVVAGIDQRVIADILSGRRIECVEDRPKLGVASVGDAWLTGSTTFRVSDVKVGTGVKLG